MEKNAIRHLQKKTAERLYWASRHRASQFNTTDKKQKKKRKEEAGRIATSREKTLEN